MMNIPVPFVTALFLVFILAWALSSRTIKLSGLPLIVIGIYALQSALIGVVWGYAAHFPVPVLGGLAALIPGFTYLALIEMVTPVSSRRRMMIVIPLIMIAGFILISPVIKQILFDGTVDIIISLLYLGFGLRLIWFSRNRAQEWMDDVPLQGLVTAHRIFLIAGLALISSPLIDLAVTYDILYNHSQDAATLVGLSNIVLLIALAMTFLFLSRASGYTGAPNLIASESSIHNERGTNRIISDETIPVADIIAELDRVMGQDRLYRDENLTLNRIARKILVPSRHISIAINTSRKMSVPQYVNLFRIIEACERLIKTDAPITSIFLDIGFTTKSNFNREFQRIAGVSPSAWRQANHANQDPRNWPFVQRLKITMPTFELPDQLYRHDGTK